MGKTTTEKIDFNSLFVQIVQRHKQYGVLNINLDDPNGLQILRSHMADAYNLGIANGVDAKQKKTAKTTGSETKTCCMKFCDNEGTLELLDDRFICEDCAQVQSELAP